MRWRGDGYNCGAVSGGVWRVGVEGGMAVGVGLGFGTL